MAIKEPVSVLFLNQQGEPLPDWLQKPLQRQIVRLSQRFPALRDLAVVQNVLDEVGQKIVAKVNDGMKIANIHAYVDVAAINAALNTTKTSKSVLGNAPLASAAGKSGEGDGVKTEGAMLWEHATEVLTIEEEEILIRYLWFGERHQEIGQALGLGSPAVRSRYSRALEKLRQHLGANSIKKPGAGA